jgi:hypothetical protein
MAIHDLSDALNLVEKDVFERRNSGRVTFDTTLGVAVYTGDSVPPPDTFIEVQGTDFSHTGIAFTTMHWPVSDQLLLMFKSTARVVYVVAQIRGCVAHRSATNDPPHFEVRCEFVRWHNT